MRVLAAAISAGDFCFTNWASAAQVASVKVAITTHQNKVLIIIPPFRGARDW